MTICPCVAQKEDLPMNLIKFFAYGYCFCFLVMQL